VGDADADLQWTEDNGFFADMAAITDPTLMDTSDVLVILPNMLEPGKTYTFRLTATNGDAIGYAVQSVQVNLSPSGGSCALDSSAISVTDGAMVGCSYWNDDQLPLQYRFGFILDGDSDPTLSDFTTDSESQLSVPTGNVTIIAVVCDDRDQCTSPMLMPCQSVGRNRPRSTGIKAGHVDWKPRRDDGVYISSFAVVAVH